MTPPKSPPQPAVSVEQVDLDAAAEYNRRFPELRLPEAFARHRISAAPPADGVLLPRAEIETLSFALRMEQRVSLKYWGDKLTEMIAAAPKSPTAAIGEAGKGLREAVCAGLRAWIASTPDIDLSSRMISDAADFIIGQPLAERGGFEAGIEAAGKALDKLAADEDAAIAGMYDSEVTDRARCAIIAAEFRRAAKIIRQCKEHAAMQLRAYDRIKP